MKHNQFSLVNEPTDRGGLYGWICPKCGAVMSPFTSFCPNCTRQNWEVTCHVNTNAVSKEGFYGCHIW